MQLRWKQKKQGDLKMVLECSPDGSEESFREVPMVGHDGKYLNEHPNEAHKRLQRARREEKQAKTEKSRQNPNK